MLYTERELDIVARTLLGEDNSVEGMTAVGFSIRNRYKISVENGGDYWWGKDLIDICLKPYQYSCWLNNKELGSNYQRLMRATLGDKSSLDLAYVVAIQVLSGIVSDPTNGATHYHAQSLTPPDWTDKMLRLGKWGGNIFYR